MTSAPLCAGCSAVPQPTLNQQGFSLRALTLSSHTDCEAPRPPWGSTFYAAGSAGLFSRNFSAFLARFREADGDGLLPAFDGSAFAASSRFQCAALSAAHCAADGLTCCLPISRHGHVLQGQHKPGSECVRWNDSGRSSERNYVAGLSSLILVCRNVAHAKPRRHDLGFTSCSIREQPMWPMVMWASWTRWGSVDGTFRRRSTLEASAPPVSPVKATT